MGRQNWPTWKSNGIMGMEMEQEAWATNSISTATLPVGEPANASGPKYVMASAIVIHDYAIFLIINKFPKAISLRLKAEILILAGPASELALVGSGIGGWELFGSETQSGRSCQTDLSWRLADTKAKKFFLQSLWPNLLKFLGSKEQAIAPSPKAKNPRNAVDSLPCFFFTHMHTSSVSTIVLCNQKYRGLFLASRSPRFTSESFVGFSRQNSSTVKILW